MSRRVLASRLLGGPQLRFGLARAFACGRHKSGRNRERLRWGKPPTAPGVDFCCYPDAAASAGHLRHDERDEDPCLDGVFWWSPFGLSRVLLSASFCIFHHGRQMRTPRSLEIRRGGASMPAGSVRNRDEPILPEALAARANTPSRHPPTEDQRLQARATRAGR